MTIRELRSKLLRPYRAKRIVPRTDLRPNHPCGFEDPAPPWVATVLDELLPRFVTERDGGYATIASVLHWCSRGEPVARAERILTIVVLWPGPHAAEVVERFLDDALSAGAGRPRGCKPKPVRAVTVLREWPKVEEPEASKVEEQ